MHTPQLILLLPPLLPGCDLLSLVFNATKTRHSWACTFEEIFILVRHQTSLRRIPLGEITQMARSFTFFVGI